jgi:hypothetical protein
MSGEKERERKRERERRENGLIIGMAFTLNRAKIKCLSGLVLL